MRKLLDRLHTKLGDLWWYSLMIFLASRAADALNVFVGLWLVPKYVGTEELGAVMPLTNFAAALAMPIAVFAMVFMKEINRLTTRKEFGQMKTLMRGVFIAAGIILLVALILSKLILPVFLVRIRIAEGSLGLLILAAAFSASIAPVYTNALQALKKFKALSILHVVGAPVRLLAMLVSMPFRALSGYFVGQCAPSLTGIVGSVVALRKELSVPAQPYWSKQVFKRLSHHFAGTIAWGLSSNLCLVIESMILRQRLPDVDSAAYYLITRFSDIAAYLAVPLLTTLFPFTAELADSGKSTRPLVFKCILAIATVNVILALALAFLGKPLLAMLPNGGSYADFAWAIPWMIGITTLNFIVCFHTNTEISAGRFKFLRWWLPLSLGYPVLMLLITGYGYFTAWLPECLCRFLLQNNITSLRSILWWMTALAGLRTLFAGWEPLQQRNIPAPAAQ